MGLPSEASKPEFVMNIWITKIWSWDLGGIARGADNNCNTLLTRYGYWWFKKDWMMIQHKTFLPHKTLKIQTTVDLNHCIIMMHRIAKSIHSYCRIVIIFSHKILFSTQIPQLAYQPASNHEQTENHLSATRHMEDMQAGIPGGFLESQVMHTRVIDIRTEASSNCPLWCSA